MRTLDDMEARVRSSDPYEVLGLSALIRKLLLDERPLIDQVNRTRRHKLVFRITDQDSPYTKVVLSSNPRLYSVQDGLDPETARPGKRVVEVNRDKFLSTTILVASTTRYSVREIVLFVANIIGGVHAGLPKSDKDHVLAAINERYALGGLSTPVRQLKAIARVTLKAMTPIRDSIRETP